MEHTKGPWRSVYLPGSKQRCAAVESPSENVYIYLLVAKNDDMDATIARWKADAALIAAAPELLEALKGIVEYYPDSLEYEDKQRFMDLIAKAEKPNV